MKLQLQLNKNALNLKQDTPKVNRPWRVVSTIDVLARLSRF